MWMCVRGGGGGVGGSALNSTFLGSLYSQLF